MWSKFTYDLVSQTTSILNNNCLRYNETVWFIKFTPECLYRINPRVQKLFNFLRTKITSVHNRLLSVCPCKPFLLSQLFVGKARSLPRNGAPFSLTRKHQTRQERLDQRYSLLGTFVNLVSKKFYNIGSQSKEPILHSSN